MALGAAVVIGAAGAAYSANQNKKNAKEANKALSKPTEYKPWDEAMPYLSGALPENKRIYDLVLNNYMSRFSGGGGGGGGAVNANVPSGAQKARQDRKAAQRARHQAKKAGAAAPGAPGAPPPPKPGPLPDSMAGDGFFQQHAGDIFDPKDFDPANDPTLAPYVEALKREMNADRDRQLLEIDDRANSIGMYGGSGRALEAGLAREQADESLANQLAAVYMGSRKDSLDRDQQARLAALGMISDRDIAAGGQDVQRMGIRSSAATARRGQNMARSQFNQQMARQDTLMPMSIYGDYLKGLGVLTNLGPNTRTGPYQPVDPGPGALGAGLSSLGGGMLAMYGMRNGAGAVPQGGGGGSAYPMNLGAYNFGYGY